MTPTYNIAGAFNFPGFWRGAASTRRVLADQMRADGLVKEADQCLRVATDYEKHAESIAAVSGKAKNRAGV